MQLTRRQHFAHLIEPGASLALPQLGMAAVFLGAALAVAVAYSVLTLPTLGDTAARFARLIFLAGGMVFVIEFLLRLWLEPQRQADPTAMTWAARRRYLTSGLGIVDLLSAVPVVLIAIGATGFETIAELSLVSLCKFARYVRGIDLLRQVIRNEARSLISVLVIVLILIVLSSALMYRFERVAQPDVFSSMPDTIWWAVVTIATVGYGDMTPSTDAGRLLGGIIIILGVATFALPTGILASGFASEMRRRNFLVTWQTVANVPLFADLSAAEISEITRLLKPETIPSKRVVVHHGDPADAMYFIMSGEVEVELTPTPVRLKRGMYFGEIALLKDIKRTATVTTMKDCQFLVLLAADFRKLVDSNRKIGSRVAKLAEGRLAALEQTSPRV